ncbi:MAG: hypothetical protein KGY54_04810 [Oleiphilaceae bacterium]|nr:hypothetical protein [Oleiphilaceae bacterium]
MYQLVFKGECTTGTEMSTARANAQALFKASLAQVDRMFSGKAVVIRNKLDEAQAVKYRQVLHKHGMVAYVELMTGTVEPGPARQQPAPVSPTSADRPREPASPAPPSGPVAEPSSAGSGHGPATEPGDRPNLAGDKVDDLLAGSGLSLDPVGITLAEPEETAPPIFQHLDEWTLAPAGTLLAEKEQAPPPPVPDVSHLALAGDDSERHGG